MNDRGNALERWAPIPGGPQRAAYAAGANAAVAFRSNAEFARYVSIMATGTIANGAHIVFGDSTVAVPTVADPLLCLEVGYQDFLAPKGATHYRIFGEGTGGFIYPILTGG